MCRKILSSDIMPQEMMIEAKNWTISYTHDDQSILKLRFSCGRFRKMAQMPSMNAISMAKIEFPLAYVFVGARNAAQTVRIVETIYFFINRKTSIVWLTIIFVSFASYRDVECVKIICQTLISPLKLFTSQ